MQLWIEIERLVWHIQISQDEDSSMNQHPAPGTLCFKYLFLLQLLKALAWPGDVRSQKKQGDGNLRIEPMSRESRQKKQTALGFSTSQICPKPSPFSESWSFKVPGPNHKSHHGPFMCYSEFPLLQRKCLGTTFCVLQVWRLTLPPICWARSASYGCSQEPFGPCLTPFISGS